MPCQPSLAPRSSGTRPLWGLRPNRPQNAAGMRIDPAPSVPSATPHSPAAAAAPDPPLDPPGVRSSAHGLRVTPKAGVSVNGQIVSSGTFVLPMTTAPAARRRRTTSASRGRGVRSEASVPRAVASPATSVSSLIATGTPSSGRASPRAAAGVGLVGLGERALGEDDAVGVELRVEAVDAVERRAHDLARGHLARGDEPCLARGAGVGEVGGVHRRRRRLVSCRDEPGPARDAARGSPARPPAGPPACTDAERRVARAFAAELRALATADADRDALGAARRGRRSSRCAPPPASRAAW